MSRSIDFVIEKCKEDPELISLLEDHPILINTLSKLSLTPDQIFQILTAAENDNFEINKRLEQLSNSVKEERLQMLYEDTVSLLLRTESYNVTLESKIHQLCSQFQDLSEFLKVKRQGSVEKESLMRKIQILEQTNLQLNKDCKALAEHNEFLNLERETQRSAKREKKKQPVKVLQAAALFYAFIAKRQLARTSSAFWSLKDENKDQGNVSKSFNAQSERINAIKQKVEKLYSVISSIFKSYSLHQYIELDLSGLQFTTEWLRSLLNSLSYNSCVSELNLSGNLLKDEGAQLIGEWVRKDEKLKTLILRSNNFTEKGSSCIIDSLCLQGQIMMLDLSHNEIDTSALMELISNNHSLTNLILENCGILGEDVKGLISASRGSQLTGLFISYNPISNSQLKGILLELSDSSIKNYGFSGLPFEESDVSQLHQLLMTHADIEVMHLAHIDISAKGFGSLLKLLQGGHLIELDVTGTKCPIPAIVNVISSNASLKTIVLREIAISEDHYLLLAKAIERAEQLEVCLLDT